MSAPDFISDDEFKPDASKGVAPAAARSPDFIPDSEFQSDEDKYGTLGQKLITGAESAGSAATFGLSKGLEKLAGVKPEDIEAREKENPLSSFAGSTAGLIGSAAIPGLGAAGLMERAGAAGAGALGLGAAEAGFASRAGAHAVKAAIEGAIFQGGNEVGKMVLSDPDQTINTSAVASGLGRILEAGVVGGVVGGGLGLAGEGIKGLWQAKFGPKIAKNLEDAQAAISGETPTISESPLGGEFGGTQPTDTLDLSGTKPNARDLQESASRLGIDLTPGTTSGEKFVQTVEGNLAERPTIAGVAIQKERNEIFKGLDKAGQEILRDATNKSEAQVGKEIQEGFENHFKDRFKQSAQHYGELKQALVETPVSEELKSSSVESLLNNEFAKADPENLGKLAKSLGKRIGNIEDLNQLKIQRTLMGDELDEALAAHALPKANILRNARDILTEMRGKAIQEGVDTGALKPDTAQKLAAADKFYSQLQKDLESFSTESATGRSRNVAKLLKTFSKVSYENLPGKVFNPNDAVTLKYFQEAFPKEFDLARRYKLSELGEKSISEAQGKNGKFEVGSFLRQLSDKKIGPEARQMLLGEHNLQKLDDIQKIYRAIPGAPNTSHTSYSEAFAKFLSPSGVVQNVTDAAQYAFLKAQPHLLKAAEDAGGGEAAHLAALKFAATPGAHPDAGAFKAMTDFIANTIKGENLVGKSVRNVFKEGETVLPSHLIPDDKSKEKLNKKLKDLQANNEPLLNVGDQVGAYMPEHSGAVAQVAMQSVNYLNSIRPSTDKQNPLDSEVKPSEVAKADFDNALAIAQQPLLVLKNIKSGNVTQKDLMHLKSMYPALYTKLQGKLQKEMIDAVHKEQVIPYKTRLGLSVFLGQPLDSTMTPNAIMAAQPKAMNVKPQGQGQQSSRGAHSMKALSKLPGSFQTPQQAREASRLKS